MTWRAIAAFAAGFLLILAVSCCTGQRTPSNDYIVSDLSDRHAFLGGPEMRVFDVYEINSVDEAFNIRAIFAMAEKCTGQTRDYRHVRVFTVSRISVRTGTGWFDTAVGVWSIGTGWVYVKRGRDLKSTTRTLVHEFAHYITQLHHEDINPIVSVCNKMINEMVFK